MFMVLFMVLSSCHSQCESSFGSFDDLQKKTTEMSSKWAYKLLWSKSTIATRGRNSQSPRVVCQLRHLPARSSTIKVHCLSPITVRLSQKYIRPHRLQIYLWSPGLEDNKTKMNWRWIFLHSEPTMDFQHLDYGNKVVLPTCVYAVHRREAGYNF